MLRHDPTFEGLLSAIALCLHDGVDPEALVPDLDQLTLLPCTDAPLLPGIRGRFRSQLASRMGPARADDVLTAAWHAWLSEDEGIGLAIYRFLAVSFRRRCDPSGDLLDPDISRVVRMARKTARLSHAFLGLIRFRTVGPALYLADFSPECHVLPLLLPHFCERLPDQCFVIRDQRRGLAALHMPNRAPQIFVLAPPGEDDPPAAGPLPFTLPSVAVAGKPPALLLEPSVPALEPPAPVLEPVAPLLEPVAPALALNAVQPQAEFDEMWRRYLAALTIPERRNLRLQRSHMPKKYWKYLTEQPGGA